MKGWGVVTGGWPIFFAGQEEDLASTVKDKAGARPQSEAEATRKDFLPAVSMKMWASRSFPPSEGSSHSAPAWVLRTALIDGR